MARRLIEQYPLGASVEIRLADGVWHAGRIVGHDHPGVWAQTADGMAWFVTNGQHIRAQARDDPSQVAPGSQSGRD